MAGSRRRYTRGGVRRALRALGFAEERATYHGALLFPLAAASRLHGNLRRRAGAPPASDVRPLPGPVNALLKAVQSAENAVVRRADLPFGVGVLTRFRRGA